MITSNVIDDIFIITQKERMFYLDFLLNRRECRILVMMKKNEGVK